MSKPTTPSSRWRTASSAISTDRAAWRIAVTISPTLIGRPCRARAEAGEHRLDRLVEAQPALDAQLGRHPHLGVDDTVRGEVLHALGRDPLDRVSGLHHRHRVPNRLEVQLQALAVRPSGEPGAQLAGIGGGQRAVSGRGRQLDDGGGSQPAVEVVVQQDLGGALDDPWVELGSCGHGHGCPASLPGR